MLKNSHLLFLSFCYFSAANLFYALELQSDNLIKEELRNVEINLRVQAVAEESVSLNNKLDDAQIKWVIPEGARVKEGDPLIKFFTDEILDDIMDEKQDLLRAQLSSNTSLLLIKGDIQAKNDRLEALLGEISILDAQRQKLRSYPIPDDVLLAKTKLNVAREEFKASESDYKRETHRYEAKMVSEKQWRKVKRDFDLVSEEVKYLETLLELEELGATERSLKIIDLKIENANIERQELESSIEIQKKIVDLKRKNIKKKIDLYESQLERVELEYENREIFSPSEGLVSYMPRLIRSIQEGTTIDKGVGLFNIVEPNKLRFKGSLKSRDVNLFKEGDPVILKFRDFGKVKDYQAKITKINRNPSDVAGESSEWSDQNKSSGIKVYEVIIEAEDETADLYPGTYGSALLKTKQGFKGPAIELKDLHWKDGQARLSIGGVYKKVHGKAIDDMFFLDDPQLLGQSYQKIGEEKVEQLKGGLPFGEMKASNRMQLTAEMEPLSAEMISVPRFRSMRSIKMGWVTEDGSVVKKGDALFKLSSESSIKKREKIEKEIQGEEAEIATAEKEHQTLIKEKVLKQKLAKNKFDIAKLELEIVQLSADVSKIYNSQYQLKQKKIQREYAQWSQEWSAERGQVIGEVEQRKLARSLKQLQLEEERAKLQFEEAMKKDEVRESSAKVQLSLETYQYESSIRSLRAKELNSLRKLEERKRALERLKRSHEKQVEEEELLTIQAPIDGTIKFLKIWDGLRMSPVAPGYTVYGAMSLATLYDISDMMIKLPLNEGLYKKVGTGLKVTVFVPSVSELPLAAHIEKVDSVFRSKARPDLQSVSLYGSQERLGEQVFYVNIKVKTPEGMSIKPGTVATVNIEWEGDTFE